MNDLWHRFIFETPVSFVGLSSDGLDLVEKIERILERGRCLEGEGEIAILLGGLSLVLKLMGWIGWGRIERILESEKQIWVGLSERRLSGSIAGLSFSATRAGNSVQQLH
ncbi:hypothetical protein COLO4_37992 [Corchorus olitorius]|uniref:Uncharacterized protein n=1 Tax=Corchorus olitorius TaxID=93759 RepID=A0A1R3FXM1_9ROSI|nr:hypothetical protein COLO4_37992 [Corchorus olitorius]